jgi:uncharacterized protein (TIRG00374 family)
MVAKKAGAKKAGAEKAGAKRTSTRQRAEEMITPLRVGALVVTALALYLLLPSITETFSAVPKLGQLDPEWSAVSLASEAVSFVCIWWLLTIALRTGGWFAVSTAQLASNALGQAVPAGAAAGAALQYRMLKGAGIDTAATGSGMAAATALQYASLFALPAIALPVVAGTGAAPSLVSAAWLGLGIFVVVCGLLALLLFTDWAPEWIGRAVQWILNHVRPKHADVTTLPDRLRTQRNLIREELGERWRPALAAAVGNWMFDFGALVAALAAVGSDPNPALVLLAYTASAVLRMIPITPGGLGFVEAGLTGTLALAGVDAESAVLATLQYRLVSFWLPLLAGPVAAVLYHRRFREAD